MRHDASDAPIKVKFYMHEGTDRKCTVAPNSPYEHTRCAIVNEVSNLDLLALIC